MHRFDINAEEWTVILANGRKPEARSQAATAVIGDLLIIWGGNGIDSLLDDIHMYNLLSNRWTELDVLSDIRPPAMKASCMVAHET